MNISWLQFPFSVKWSSPSKSDSQMGPPRQLVQHIGRFIKLPLITYFCTGPFPKHVCTDVCSVLQFRCPGSYRNEVPWGGREPALPNSHRGLFRNTTVCCSGTASCQEVSGLFAFTFPFGSSYRSCCLPLGIHSCWHLEVISRVSCHLHASKTHFSG